MKLRVELYRYCTLVFGTILEQDESLRSKGTIAKDEDGYKIASIGIPEIGSKVLYIRVENTGCDYDAFSYDFNSEEEAIEWITHIKALIDKINEKPKEVEGYKVVKEL